jgi:hypothetical protein
MWNVQRTVLALTAALFAGLSLLQVKAEFGAAQTENASVALQLDILAAGAIDLPLSWRGRRGLLLSCIEVSQSLEIQLMPADYALRIHASCEGLVRQVMASSPTASEAYLARALMADPADAAQGHVSLAIAQSLAPLESWQIRLRSERALDHSAELGGPARKALEADLRVLLGTRWGQAWLAQLFITDPGRRDAVHGMLVHADAGEFE